MRINGFQNSNTNISGLYQNQATKKNQNTDPFELQLETKTSPTPKTKAASPQVSQAEAWGVPSAEKLKTSFTTWVNQIGQSQSVGADRISKVQDYAEAFEALIDKASANGGYDDPIAFIRGLSEQERATLQHMHGLADPIGAGTLTQEGALNLLLPPNEAKDLNKDGFVMKGIAKTWVFPPVDASPEVRQAWEQATAHMTEAERFTATGYFLPSPDQPAYLGDSLDSYLQLVQGRLEGAEFSRQFDFSWQHEHRQKQIDFLKDFLNILSDLK